MNSDNLIPMGYMYAYGNGLMFLRLVSFQLQCNYTQDNELKEGTLFGLLTSVCGTGGTLLWAYGR